MGNIKRMYVTAKEAAEMLGVSTGYAYKLIRGLNEELKEKGYRTICGKVILCRFYVCRKKILFVFMPQAAQQAKEKSLPTLKMT